MALIELKDVVKKYDIGKDTEVKALAGTSLKIEKGEMKPSIYKVLPFEDANEALDILERGENIGKVVLRVCNE